MFREVDVNDVADSSVGAAAGANNKNIYSQDHKV